MFQEEKIESKRAQECQEFCNSRFILDSCLFNCMCKWSFIKKQLLREHIFSTSGQTIVLVQHAVLCVRKFIDERRALELMFDLKNLCPLFLRKTFAFTFVTSLCSYSHCVHRNSGRFVYFLFMTLIPNSKIYWLTRVAGTASGETLPLAFCLLATFRRGGNECYFSIIDFF